MKAVPASAVEYVNSGTEPISRQLWSLRPNLSEAAPTLGRSQMNYALNEISKSILNWIGKGQDEKLRAFGEDMDYFLSLDQELDDPLFGVSLKRRFGASLASLLELINVYRYSDLEIKDYHLLMLESKVSNRLRKVLLAFFQSDHRLNIRELYYLVYIKGSEVPESLSEQQRKFMQRDLDILIRYALIQKVVISPKKIVYETSPRANAYRNDIMHRELGINEYLLYGTAAFSSQAAAHAPLGQMMIRDSTIPASSLVYNTGNT
jgi:hypothetical protein